MIDNATTKKKAKFVPVILSGGAGTRLWPVSRELHPKPFIRLADSQSLLQKAFLRATALPDVEHVLTVTNRELFFKTEDEYREVSERAVSTDFILEPVGRNTAPAIAAAAMQAIELYGEDVVLLVLAADHLIENGSAFSAAVNDARSLAEQGYLVTLGIRPERAETGYGYIESDGTGVKRFVEKASVEIAQAYVKSGRYLWNSGIFCFQAKVVVSELDAHSPEITAAIRCCIDHSRRLDGNTVSQLELNRSEFAKVPNISIDYALMEKSDHVAVVPCEIGWSDLGSWSALAELIAPDSDGNRVQGDALLVDTSDCYVYSEDRIVGTVGINNLVIIDTPDALLVADRESAQNVKEIVQQLGVRGHEACRTHQRVHRPWGTYTVLEGGARFKIKRIEVKPGASLSLQMHYHRSEHWIVVSGMARIINGAQEIFINTNESTYIPAGNRHRLENPGKLPLVMIEVQCGDYLEEDDIVRFEDSYGRV